MLYMQMKKKAPHHKIYNDVNAVEPRGKKF